MPLKIHIESIPHKAHRYEGTVGDWWRDKDGTIQIRVSDMKNWKWELLVALHELCEQSLCRDRKITDRAVTKFDVKYEAERKKGKHPDYEEAGDDLRAPYRLEHSFASGIERLLGAELKVDWNSYADTVESL